MPGAMGRLDDLLRLKPGRLKWFADAPDPVTAKPWAFATWPNDLNLADSGYWRDLPTDPGAGGVTGYSDQVQPDDWRFKDIAFSSDDTPRTPPNSIDAIPQLRNLTERLRGTSGTTDELRSFKLVSGLLGSKLREESAQESRRSSLAASRPDGNA